MDNKTLAEMGEEMKPHYQDNHNTIYCQDFRANDLPDEYVQMVCTSPPYWGLRKYSGEQDLIWGDNHCDHQFDLPSPPRRKRDEADIKDPRSKQMTHTANAYNATDTSFCSLCGAWRGAFGLEPTPEMYVQHTIEILREIRRVLRKDGVVFWNIGDSYWGGKGQSGQPMSAEAQQKRHGRGESINQAQHQMEMSTRPQDGKHNSLKPKDLCLIPFHVAIEAQRDGWWVRSVIIWSKNNPMPESVKDRPTESHEYILMLTKSARYYWGQGAVREKAETPLDCKSSQTFGAKGGKAEAVYGHKVSGEQWVNNGSRNLRSVWTFPTQPYPEAHFAVFPEKLPELCIKAASRLEDIILDPFMGSGTTLWVAKKLGRQAIGYELSEEYCKLALERNRQQVLI